MRFFSLFIVVALMVACSPTQPDLPPVPTSSNTCTVTGSGTCNIGNGNGNVTNPPPSPTPSGAPGDNEVAGFAVFCYGFGTQPGQAEPNHELCQLPSGYPSIAVTASPKNKAGVDVPSPGDATDPKVIDWTLSVNPPNGATLQIQGANRFNATVVPAAPRVSATFVLTATYKDPNPKAEIPVHVATKSGSIVQ